MRTFFATLALLATASCSGLSMMEWQDHQAFEQAVANARTENDVHHRSVAAAATMEEVAAEMARHQDAASAIHGDMRLRIGHVAFCDYGTSRDDMLGMMDAADEKESDHQVAVAQTSSVEEARVACDVHFTSMSGLLQGMDERWGDMACM
jgi:hypothetical protein